MTDRYDDILHLSSPGPGKHPRMSLQERAAQFSPFAALSGYDEELAEDDRLTEEFTELSEEAREELDRKLLVLSEMIRSRPVIRVTRFLPDKKKDGGAYVSLTQRAVNFSAEKQTLRLEDGSVIPLHLIVSLEGSIFE